MTSYRQAYVHVSRCFTTLLINRTVCPIVSTDDECDLTHSGCAMFDIREDELATQ